MKGDGGPLVFDLDTLDNSMQSLSEYPNNHTFDDSWLDSSNDLPEQSSEHEIWQVLSLWAHKRPGDFEDLGREIRQLLQSSTNHIATHPEYGMSDEWTQSILAVMYSLKAHQAISEGSGMLAEGRRMPADLPPGISVDLLDQINIDAVVNVLSKEVQLLPR